MARTDEPAAPLSARAEQRGDIQVVRFRGELDLVAAPTARRAVEAAACSMLEVDLAELTFLDAAGLAALLSARDEAIARRCHVRVVGPRGSCAGCSPSPGCSRSWTDEPHRLTAVEATMKAVLISFPLGASTYQ